MTVKAKICGLKTESALDAALAGGADYIGVVFFPKSPRNVGFEQARRLAERARGRAKVVALTVDPSDALLLQIAEHVSPDAIQLHGEETPDRVRAIRSSIGRDVWKAIPVASAADAGRAYDYLDAADLILFDAKAPKDAVLPGGNGRAFDWTALDQIKGRFPFMLSGGLNPANVAEAIAATAAQAVDVSSGVETAPGEKDARLIESFLRAVKGST